MSERLHERKTLESTIIQRILTGDTEAFGELIGPHEKAMYHAAWKYCRNPEDAADVVQEAVLKAFQAIPRFRGDSALSTWLVQITINEARLRLRKNRPHLFQSLEEFTTPRTTTTYADQAEDKRERPDKRALREELERRLEKAIWNLSAEYRKVIILRHIFHMDTLEVAKAMASTVGATRTRLTRARAVLRNALLPAEPFLAGNEEVHPSLENVPVECARVLSALNDLIDDAQRLDVLRDAQRHFCKCVRCSAVVRGAHTLVSVFCDLREFTLVERFGATARAQLFRLMGTPR